MAYFNYDRKRWATEDIAICYECAEKAGIKDRLFINFGVLLGIVRDGDFIRGDDDVDMSVHTDGITKDQQDCYIEELRKKGMFFARERVSRRSDTGMATWFTLRRRKERAKFCHWWGFEHKNYWWWSKGGRWVHQSKFGRHFWEYGPETQAIALGILAENVQRLIWVKFRGINVQIPERKGSVLDWEYPGWLIPQSGSSRKQVGMIIERWDDKRTWKIKLANPLM